jgi:hypothetical protein
MSVENNTPLPIFGADAETAWIFSEEKLAEMRTAAHSGAQEAVARFMRSMDSSCEGADSVGPSPGKKAKMNVGEITLAEDLMLQVGYQSSRSCFWS